MVVGMPKNEHAYEHSAKLLAHDRVPQGRSVPRAPDRVPRARRGPVLRGDVGVDELALRRYLTRGRIDEEYGHRGPD